MHFEKLTNNRKQFVTQLINLIDSTFGEEADINKRIKTISINASWGMGKTLLKSALEEKLQEDSTLKVMTINAWETDYFNDPMKSLIGEINESKLNISTDTIKKGEILIKNAGSIFTKLLGTAFLKKLNFSNSDIENIKSLLKGIDSSGIEDYTKYKKLIKDFKNSFEIGMTTPKRVIIIDELDRCKPNYAIEMLEAVKHIFDIYNLTFIFLINKEQMKYTVKNLYGCESESEDYFEKFFDVQLKLPEIDIKDFLQIEYDKYDYNVSNFGENDKFNFESFMLALLLRLIQLNYNSLQIKSIRQLQKSLNKFNYLIKTFTKEEKLSLFTVLGFVSFFIKNEYYNIDILKNRDIPLYRFDIRQLLDSFLTADIRNGFITEIRAIEGIYNDKCMFNSRDVEAFYAAITFTNKLNFYSISNDPAKKIVLNNITAQYDNNFHGDQAAISLPLTIEYMKKYDDECLIQWCKEKYEFTHLIEN